MDVKSTLLNSGDITDEKAVADKIKEIDQLIIPLILKDRTLISPGKWNNAYYTDKTIKDTYANTVWDESARSLFYEHSDRDSRDWVGDIKNIRVSDNGTLLGDLWIVDEGLARKLVYGAKFGVSPKIIGESDIHNVVYNGVIKNFGLVLDPGCKTAFLNSEIKELTSEEPPKLDESKPVEPTKIFENTESKGGNVMSEQTNNSNEFKEISAKIDALTKSLETISKTTIELDADRQKRLVTERENAEKAEVAKREAEKQAIVEQSATKEKQLMAEREAAEAKAKDLEASILKLNAELEQAKTIVKPTNEPVKPTEEPPKVPEPATTNSVAEEARLADSMRVLDKTGAPAGFTNSYTDGDVAMAKFLKDSVDTISAE